MKKSFFILFCSLAFSDVFSQENFSKYSIGAGGGLTKAYADMSVNPFKQAYLLNSDYYFTPFFTAGIEGQYGKIAGSDTYQRAFENSYLSGMVTSKLHLGQMVRYRNSSFLSGIKGLYAGTGLGFIKNKMTSIVRIKPDGSNYTFPGADAGTGILLPLMAGINFNIPDGWGETRFILSFGYQMNITMGEGLDGYNDPPPFKNNNPDMYSFAHISIKYCFGPEGIFYTW